MPAYTQYASQNQSTSIPHACHRLTITSCLTSLHAHSDRMLGLVVQGCAVEVEGIVKGRLSFTVMDREGLHIARLGSPDLNFAQLWIKVLPCYSAELKPCFSTSKAQATGSSPGR